MKSNNRIGVIIIIGIIMIAAMQAFNIEFNLENIKKAGSLWIGIAIAILIFLGMQSKKSSNPEHYIEPEVENNLYNTPGNNENRVHQNYQSNDVRENEDPRYSTNYNQNSNPTPNHYQVPEEDNRWS